MTTYKFILEIFISVDPIDITLTLGTFLYGLYQFLYFGYTRLYGTRIAGKIIGYTSPKFMKYFVKPIIELEFDEKNEGRIVNIVEGIIKKNV